MPWVGDGRTCFQATVILPGKNAARDQGIETASAASQPTPLDHSALRPPV